MLPSSLGNRSRAGGESVELQLDQEDATLLRSVLAGRLSELRSEVVHTERYGLRVTLKDEEARIRSMLARLEGVDSHSGPAIAHAE